MPGSCMLLVGNLSILGGSTMWMLSSLTSGRSHSSRAQCAIPGPMVISLPRLSASALRVQFCHQIISASEQASAAYKGRLAPQCSPSMPRSSPSGHVFDQWLSVLMSQHIARAHPEDIRVLNGTAFYHPHWKLNSMVFKSDDFDFDSHPGYT